MKRIIFLVICAITIMSCNDDKKQPKNEDKVEVKETSGFTFKKRRNNNIKLNFEGLYEKEDLFLVYYSTKKNTIYNTQNFITKEIKANNDFQNIEIEFPKGINPYDLRIDFSGNNLQKEIKFNRLVVSDSLNYILINKNNLSAYFDLPKDTEFNKKTSTLKGNLFKLTDTTKGYNPYINSNAAFRASLNIFNQGNSNKKITQAVNDIENIDLNDGKFRFIIDGIFKSNDQILLYYSNSPEKGLYEKTPLKIEITGSEKEQKIIISIPEEDLVSSFRLDISENIKQEGIAINNFSIIEGKVKKVISKEELHKYLSPNEYIDFNSTTGGFLLQTVLKEGTETYNPYFMVTKMFIDELSSF